MDLLAKILEFWPLLVIFFGIIPVGSYGFYKHAIKHTDGSDDIQTADAAQKGLMSASHVTNLTNVKNEVETARGSKASLDGRLEVEHNEDGTHKTPGARDKKNLKVKVNATNPTYQIDIDADTLQVDEYSLASINLTVDITQSGVNGLDTGAEAANTWYALLVIYNPTTKAIAGLFTISPSSPTLPAGYTKYRRVGWVRNDASSNFLKFYHNGDWWYWDIHHNVLTTQSAATSWTDVDCSSYVPPTSELFVGTICSRDSDSTATHTFIRRNGSGENGEDYSELAIAVVGATAVEVRSWGSIFSCDNSQIIEYKNAAGDERAIINILGYYDPI